MVRRTAARVALVLLALSATLALGGASGAATAPTTIDPSAATTLRERDHAFAVATAPVVGSEWAAQHRGPSGTDRSAAVLLAVAALVVGRRWSRVRAVTGRVRIELRGCRSAIRGPPAFA